MHLSPPSPPRVAKVAVCSEAVVLLLLLIYCLMYFQLFVGILYLYLFCYALLCVHSSFAIMLKRKSKLVALLLLPYRLMYCYYKCSVALPHGAVGWSAVCDCDISRSYSLFSINYSPYTYCLD